MIKGIGHLGIVVKDAVMSITWPVEWSNGRILN